jgi:hypothetical protein
MLGFFDSVINEVIELVKSQIDAAVEGGDTIHQVFLVGGFGASPYLNARLREWCETRDIYLKSTPAW